jgi:hypothetical protein
MSNADLNLNSLRDCCDSIIEQGKELFTWQWDPYFGAALTVITADNQAAASQLLEGCCGKPLDAQSITNGPEHLRAIMDKAGGLRSGQKVFFSDTDQPAFVLVAWWPWGNGASISVRVRLAMATGEEIAEDGDVVRTFRGWFGL